MIKPILNWFWNLEILTGHRSQVARVGLQLAALVMAYQSAALSEQLIGSGINLPDVPAKWLAIVAALSVFLAGKMKKFVKEHEE